jgi:tRNA(Ile)-lysidine synthase
MWIDIGAQRSLGRVAPLDFTTRAEHATNLVDRVAVTGLIEPGRSLVVMCSGGADSTCLLAIAVELGAQATALHVNYGLRGNESDGDEASCRELCDRLGVALQAEKAPPKPAGNTQAWARDIRYAAAELLANRHGASIAVGHTATDLYRLATSPGRRALQGMESQRDNIVRPLLAAAATRDETAAFCTDRALPWRDDSSNADRSYARVRVRDGLLPALLAVDSRAHDNVLRTADILRAEGEVLDELVNSVLDGRQEIGADELRALNPALARLVLRRLAEAATGRSGARTATRLEEILALQSGALDTGDGARAEVRNGRLRVIPTPDP